MFLLKALKDNLYYRVAEDVGGERPDHSLDRADAGTVKKARRIKSQKRDAKRVVGLLLTPCNPRWPSCRRGKGPRCR